MSFGTMPFGTGGFGTIGLPAGPSVSNVTPPDFSTLAPFDAFGFDVLAPGGFRRVLVFVSFPGAGVPADLAYDGGTFCAGYGASTVQTIDAVTLRFLVRRSAGWPQQTQPRIFAFDQFGQEL